MAVECFRCGAFGEDVILSDAISKEGIVKICDNCLKEDGLPLLKKPTTYQLKEAEQPSSVYERLSSIAGLNAKEHKKNIFGAVDKKKQELKEQEVTLKELVDKNYQKKLEKEQGVEPQPKPGLIDNFHWIIMRVRRMRKLSQVQLAEKIGEAEAAIQMAEKGVLPEDYYVLVRKLENFLGIKISKAQPRQEGAELDIREKPPQLEKPEQIKFNGETTKTLTISDLKELKAEQDTKAMSNEIEEDIMINEEFKAKLLDKKEE
jgi:ribosome-binding protein aMBF1 (putative translation factor)